MATLITGGPLFTPGRVHDPGAILLERDVIRAAGAAGSFPVPRETETVDVAGQRIIPGLIDLHLHAFGGHNAGGSGLAEVIRTLPARGTTAFLPTTIATPPDQLLQTVRTMADVLDAPPIGAQALGIHMEGPWVSRIRSGGLRAEFCYPLTQPDVERFCTAARGAVRMITLAPEEGEALSVIPWLVERGIVPSIGHSDADYDTVKRAVALGLNHATHAFNAMRPLHHRDPGTVGAVLDCDAIVAQLIADGYHVHPPAMHVLIRAKGIERVCLISDAVLAGLPPGEYDWDGRRVVCDGSSSRFPDGAVAGSAMVLNQMLRVIVERVGLPFSQALRMATEVPARVLGLRKGRLLPGYDADVVVLRDDGEPSLTMISGEVVYRE